MNSVPAAYGQWSLVVINSLMFINFAFGNVYRASMREVPAFVPKFVWQEDERSSPARTQYRGE